MMEIKTFDDLEAHTEQQLRNFARRYRCNARVRVVPLFSLADLLGFLFSVPGVTHVQRREEGEVMVYMQAYESDILNREVLQDITRGLVAGSVTSTKVTAERVAPLAIVVQYGAFPRLTEHQQAMLRLHKGLNTLRDGLVSSLDKFAQGARSFAKFGEALGELKK